jgi:hypothetical protein
MRNKLVWLAIIVIIIIIIFTKCNYKDNEGTEFNPINISVGQEFTNIDYNDKMTVLNYEVLDITGDKKKDMAILVGQKEVVTDTFAKNIDVVIYDGSSKTFIKADLRNFEGHLPSITVSDFNGDKVSDILVVVDKDGTSKSYCARIISYSDKKLQEIFKERDNRGITFIGNFEDGYRAKIMNRKLSKEITIDLSDRKESYIANKFYDDAGRLLVADAKVTTEPLRLIEKVELNDRTGIRMVQKIIGFDNLDIIDEIESIWKYENGRWQIKELKGNKVGNLLY